MAHPTANSPDSVAPPTPPAVCPACQSSAIVTAAKIPDAESYWRCTACGEMWNVSRSQTDRYGRPRWR